MTSEPRFYFTVHPGDLSRQRLLPGVHVMLVASAHWDGGRKRFRVRRPPADHVASLAVDSGGFTAAKRWGEYPWSPTQYADFVREVSRDVPLDFCAAMDYACEPAVNRTALATNRERITASLTNERACHEADPDLPWLAVLQGDSLTEREHDLSRRRELALLPADYAGVGSVCGRGARAAARILRFYHDRLPGVRYHGFGLHVGALADDVVLGVLRSWDTYAWTWPKGEKGLDRPEDRLRDEGETWSSYVVRLASLYQAEAIAPRLMRPRQLLLEV